MKRITIHQFEESPEEYIRLAESGESIELMDGDRPVAMVTQVKKDETTAERLTREGQLLPAKRKGPLSFHPLEPQPGEPLPSEELMRDRSGD